MVVSSIPGHQTTGRLVLGWVTVLSLYVTSHPGQLSLLPYVGQKMSSSQSAVMLCN